jgi:hypothetical protein
MAAMLFAAMYGGIFILIIWAGIKLFRRRNQRLLEEPDDERIEEDEPPPLPLVLTDPPPTAPEPSDAPTLIACETLNPADVVHCMTERGSHYLFRVIDAARGLFLMKGRHCQDERLKRWQEVRLEGTITRQGMVFKRFVVGGTVRVWLVKEPLRYLTTSRVVRLFKTDAN